MVNVNVSFVTNRDYQPGNKLLFGPHFNPDGVAALRFGKATFAVDDTGAPTVSNVDVYPDVKGETDISKTGGGKFLNDLRLAMLGDNKDTLVFIHGFNVSFTSAMLAAARLAAGVTLNGKPVNVVLFSWPSDGKAVPLMSYYSDREDARASGPALARAFLKLREFLDDLDKDDYCQGRVHLLTHSMGAYVLRNGLQAALAKDPKSLIRVFEQILLAAPDEDDDAFETDAKLALLPRLGRQVTVYFNPNDKALIISDTTKANPDRLGSDGPRLIDLIPKKVVLVDCRNVAGSADPIVEHGYFNRSLAMAADIGAVLLGTPPESITNRAFVDHERAWRIVAEVGVRPGA